MKNVFLTTLLFYNILLSDTSFITQEEYSAQLYKNPRGIGCYHCHGKHGEGRLVARYVHKGEARVFSGPPINLLNIEEFSKALNEGKRGMPRYFLTQKEIDSLYLHVNITLNEEESEDEE